jgi:type I restriction enzyme S subunit
VSDARTTGWSTGILGEFLPIKYGKSLPAKLRDSSGRFPVFGSSGRVGLHVQPLTNGPTLIVGRKGTVGAVHLSTEPCWPIDTVYFSEGEQGQNLRYFKYLLDSLNLVQLDKSTAIPGLSRDDYNALNVRIAPPVEQERIVAEVEKQFSRLDEAVANLKRVKANLKRYKAAVLKAAVEGRLVPTEAELAEREGREFETGDQLLQQILETRRAMFIGKGRYKEPETGRAEWQYALPAGWTWVTLGQLALSVKDGPHYSPAYSDQGIPFISGGNIRPEGVDFTLTKYISPQLHAELSKRCKPEQGDLLYTKGGTTGIARINTESREFNVWVHVAVLKLTKFVQPFYVQHALNSQHCYRQAQQYTHGVGNQDLGLTRMVWITMPLPPLAEQHRIVAEVDRRLSIVREVESEVDANLKRAETLRQAVLARAFAPTGTTGAGQSEQAVAPA